MFRMLKSSIRRRSWRRLTGALLSVALAASPGVAVAKSLPKASTAAKLSAKDAAKPTLVGTFGDWGAYEAQGPKSKICYALAQPKQRTPASLKRDGAYVFISSRPGEGVRNEISVIMGVPIKDGSTDAKAEVGTTAFDLVTKGQNAWMKNAAQESQLIDVMKKHVRLVVKAPLVKGSVADSYSLTGLAQALDRVSKDCP